MKTIADLIEDRFGLETEAGRDMPAEGDLANILGHRSHRRYKPDPVPENLLEVLLSAAFSAPAKSDLQQSGILIVRDTEKRKKIEALMPAMPWIAEAPVFMVFLADNRRIRRISEMRGTPFANDHLDSVLNAAVDAGLVLMNFIRAAESVGLGCCPISVVRNHIETVSELLELPEHVFPLCGFCLGWPAGEGHISLRLPPRVMVHTDRYDDSGLEAEVAGYDARRSARYRIPDEKQRLVDEYGLAQDYGWSEDKARQVSKPERMQLAKYLRSQGFNLE
ncbi:nitroreductase family protein [Nisaea acidiphila]|uniref:Nitroreductase family protein n=1 Tax=Nisaea acidiphila TaxID=1862145 RepID=A0A9J7AM24_9PROT|nr:nitroreductase family protein [Nisaea acidiphila]UUX48215.1 nitroreductase family protein [Nisaea acidiphila]